VQGGAEAAVEVRMPYLDLRLVELVLSLSWRHRMLDGDDRRLQRDAAAPFLPDMVLRRRDKANFNVTLANQFTAHLPRIQALFQDRNWVAAPFVNQKGALMALQHYLTKTAGKGGSAERRTLWNIALFEAWLRLVLGYDARRKGY